MTKNFKILKKEVDDDSRRWEDLPCLWVDRNNSLKKNNKKGNNKIIKKILKKE